MMRIKTTKNVAMNSNKIKINPRQRINLICPEAEKLN